MPGVGHYFTAFTRAGRVPLAILDLVSRKWLTTLLVHTREASPSTCRSSTPGRSRLRATVGERSDDGSTQH
jgi:hypothetical protein